MANLSEDIQCAGFDIRPPILDRTDFASWQQRIRMYGRGKENRVNILKSIDEGPFQMETFRETLAEGNESALHLGPEQPRVYSDISLEEKNGRHNRGQGNNARGAGAAGCGGAQNRVGNANSCQARQTLNMDNVFQADDCDVFDSDVDEAPNAQTMFMENLSSAYLVYDEAGPPYNSDILSEVHDHDHYQDIVCEHHKVHEMHDDVQPNYVIDSHANYTSDSNMIPYVKDNAMPVV
nr:integrase, catalytic region, zinc finger, CCHC-type, peptidase aspartic, catalytic [Tanacetum cinerariifolium]